MLKRRNSTKEVDTCNNKVQVLNKNEKEKPQLPIELIIKIISYLNDTKDLRNCLMLSKNIRHSFFKTAELMKRFDFEFSTNTDFVDEIKFLRTYGDSIQYLNLNYPYDSPKFMKFILNLMPNLIVLEFKNSEALTGLDEKVFVPLKLEDVEPPELQKLKNLVLEVVDYEEFFEIFKNVKNIQRICYKLSNDNIEDEFLDFLVQQDDLKELTMVGFYGKTYEIRDISQEVKFQLRSMNCFGICENFQKFFKSQAEHLQEFRHINLSDEILKILFENCRKLYKIDLYESYEFEINWNDYIGYRLETVKFLEYYNTKRISLADIYEIFPNLESLKCWKILNVPGFCFKLQTLNIEILYLNCFKNIGFPDLTSLTVKYLKGFHDKTNFVCKVKKFNEKNLKKLIQNVPNLKNLTVDLTENKKSTKCVFKHLKNFPNLQFAEINFSLIRSDEQHRITINFDEKTITSERIIYYVKDLRDNFEDFVFQCTDGKLDEDTMVGKETKESESAVDSETSSDCSSSDSSSDSD